MERIAEYCRIIHARSSLEQFQGLADLITFNRAKGVYGGLNLDGTVVTASDDWNASFYGKKVLPPDILVRASVHNAAADKLLAQVAAAGMRAQVSAAGKK